MFRPGVDPRPTPELAPCPFCRCGSLLVIGGGRRFLYYRCASCAEVWTVTTLPPITPQQNKRTPRLRSSSEGVLS